MILTVPRIKHAATLKEMVHENDIKAMALLTLLAYIVSFTMMWLPTKQDGFGHDQIAA